ncbi:MAG TPA: hypothetical protein VD968_07740 [Pyrinomonadaceae bacterium]|nr:hypothetical protein [Pyrinomonadaceae bacterium]
MSEQLRRIAARYASALRTSERLAARAAGCWPAASDIWLWRLEDVASTLVEHWKGKAKPDYGRYDHHSIYAHRYCLNSKEDVQNAPDSVLFQMMGLNPSQEWGWLQFMVRELGWHSMIAANWGLPVLQIPDGVTYSTTTEEQRRAQSVAYYLELMRERGRDLMPQIREFAEKVKAKVKERKGRKWGEDKFTRWLRQYIHWIYCLYAFADKPNPPGLLTPPGEPKYVGDHRAEFAAEIFAAAERRRRNWDAPHPADCLEREAERREAEGLAAERKEIEEHLSRESYRRWVAAAAMGAVSDGELREGFMEHYGDGKGATGKDDTFGHIQSMEAYLNR